MSEQHFDLQLEQLNERSVGRLLNADVFDIEAFKALLSYLDAKAERMRGEFGVSKQVLSCLRGGAAAIRSRAEYLPAIGQHCSIADEFEMILDLMIIGETRSDRLSPRAV